MIDIVYVEKEAMNTPFARGVLEKIPGAVTVPIDRWEDVFYRKKQDYALQKKNRKLIIGVNRGDFVMEGSDNCQSAGADSFYYCSFAKNCIGGCDYCYLQGMLRSGYLLAFANMDDCFRDVEKVLNKGKKTLLAVSYDNDIYALEGLFGYVKMWSDFAKNQSRQGLTIEVRTKCGTKSFIDRADSSSGVLAFTWSVSSAENIKRFEPQTSPLAARLDAAAYALAKGFRVRLALDPAIALGGGWKEGYDRLCDEIGARGIGGRLDAVMLGGFRIPADYLKIMRRNAPNSPIPFDSYDVIGGTACYPKEKEIYVTEYIAEALRSRAGVPQDRIFLFDR
ncbi:MAG: hypothetical protein J5921_05455 [Clostridia bacterium]|nr:hypothetical protein [Clostridia bacterium]